MSEKSIFQKPVEGYVSVAKRERAIKELKDEYRGKELEAKEKGLKIPLFVLDESKVKELYLKFGGLYIPTGEEKKIEEARLKAEAEAIAAAKAEAEAKAKEEERSKIRAEVEAELKSESKKKRE